MKRSTFVKSTKHADVHYENDVRRGCGMKTEDILKRKPAQIALCVFSVLFSAYCVNDFSHLVRKTHTREVMREFSAAVDALQKSPPGIERTEVFLKRVKGIKLGYTPVEVKQALHDYIAALEQGLDALKAGRDTQQYDDSVAAAKKRLIESVEKSN